MNNGNCPNCGALVSSDVESCQICYTPIGKVHDRGDVPEGQTPKVEWDAPAGDISTNDAEYEGGANEGRTGDLSGGPHDASRKSRKRGKGKAIAVLSVIGVVLILFLVYVLQFMITGNPSLFSTDEDSPVPNRPPSVDLYVSDFDVHTLEEIEFTAKWSDPDGEVLKWEWDFDGDGEFDEVSFAYANITRTFSDDGVFTPELRITDDHGDYANDSVEITVRNRRPSAELEISSTVELTNNEVFFNVSADDRDGTVSNYIWDFDGDGETDLTTRDTNVGYTYPDNGIYRAGLTVVDDDDGKATYHITITVENRPPEVEARVNRTSADTYEPMTFSAEARDDDGSIVLYEWDFNDDGIWDWSSGTGSEVEYLYEDDGNYDALVRVTDDDEAITESYVSVTVNNVRPTATASVSDDNVSTLSEVTFFAGGSDPDGAIVLYEWDFEGDGDFDWDSETRGVDATHSYDDDGHYGAVLRVTDDDDATATDITEITVRNRAPEAEALVETTLGVTYADIEFDGLGTDDDGSIVLYEWDFEGDEAFDWSSPTTAHTIFNYTVGGSYDAYLRVTDDDGDTDISGVTITIAQNRQPLADAGDDMTVDVDEPITLDGSGSSDPDGHSLEYDWDYGDGDVGEGSILSHTYIQDGTYTATLTVTDVGGLSDSDTCTITVEVLIISKYAVVIGIADYPGHGSDLDYPDEDADYWESYLTDHGYTVHKLVDSQATRDNILAEIAWMAGAEGSESYCVFAYSGHGDYDSGSFLLDYTEEGLWDHELAQAFSAFESQHIFFFFDCCASGGFDDDLGGAGRYVAEACGIDEFSLDDPDYSHGAFTYWFLVDGLDRHASWSVEDAFDHAYDHCSSDYDWDNFHPEERDPDVNNPFYLY